VIQGGLLDKIQVQPFGIITLIVVALIVLGESVWTWLNDDKAQTSAAAKERRHPGS
jgi:hypothetical protein